MGIHKGKLAVIVLIALLVIQPVTVAALSSGEAKQDWRAAKERTLDAQEAHREAKILWAQEKTPENNQNVIDTGKDLLNAALGEAESWLIWKECEVDENPDIPDELSSTIKVDIATNLAKIEVLREEVDAIETQFDLGIMTLKMVGTYLELITDVARDSGFVWVHVATTYADRIEVYEGQLRNAAENTPENGAIIDTLDRAATELAMARTNINAAQSEYDQVRLPGTPLVKFSNGNNYLKIARGNMISAQGYLNQAYNLILRGEGR